MNWLVGEWADWLVIGGCADWLVGMLTGWLVSGLTG